MEGVSFHEIVSVVGVW